jgi:hypothetical protein
MWWHMVTHGGGGWRGNWQMEWVASTLQTTSENVVSSITTNKKTDPHTSAASNRLNWHPRRFKWTRPFRRKKKSGFCACAITFQLASNCDKISRSPNAIHTNHTIAQPYSDRGLLHHLHSAISAVNDTMVLHATVWLVFQLTVNDVTQTDAIPFLAINSCHLRFRTGYCYRTQVA